MQEDVHPYQPRAPKRRDRLNDNSMMASLGVKSLVELLLSRWLTAAHVQRLSIYYQVVLMTVVFGFLIAVVLS
jgi:hypothetical protein